MLDILSEDVYFKVDAAEVVQVVFYVVEPISQPEILFACSVVNDMQEGSRNIIDHREGVIEIEAHKNLNGDMIVQTEYGIYRFPDGAIGVYMPDCRYDCRPSASGSGASFSSVAVRFSDLHLTRYEEQDLERVWSILQEHEMSLVLPQVFTESLTQTVGDETRLIQSKILFCINTYKEHSANSRYSCLSQWYDICAEMDRHFREMICSAVGAQMNGAKRPGSHYYVYKAKMYINLHADERIKPAEISAYLGLSHAYFTKLFKKETGTSLNAYIMQMRLYHLRSMLERNDGRSLKEIAAECGFADIRYVQRLFLKYAGMSMQEYRKQASGLTLYHTNPWLEKDLTSDLLKKDKLLRR